MIELEKDYEETLFVPAGQYITAREYCAETGEKLSTVRVRISRGKIRSYIFGSKRLIPVGEIGLKRGAEEA